MYMYGCNTYTYTYMLYIYIYTDVIIYIYIHRHVFSLGLKPSLYGGMIAICFSSYPPVMKHGNIENHLEGQSWEQQL